MLVVGSNRALSHGMSLTLCGKSSETKQNEQRTNTSARPDGDIDHTVHGGMSPLLMCKALESSRWCYQSYILLYIKSQCIVLVNSENEKFL